MMKTLTLITLLMAPFAVQAQTVEFGPGGVRVIPHGGGDCRELRAACMHKEEMGETGMGNCPPLPGTLCWQRAQLLPSSLAGV